MDFTPEALGVWTLIGLFVVKFWLEVRKDNRDVREEKGAELATVEARLQREVDGLREEIREVRSEAREGQKEVFLQMQGATNGIARLEGAVMKLSEEVKHLREKS